MPGHIGDPAHATAEKGESLFATFTDGVCGFLDQVIAWDGVSWMRNEHSVVSNHSEKKE